MVNTLPILHGKPLQVHENVDKYIGIFSDSDKYFKYFANKYLNEFSTFVQSKISNEFFGGADGAMYHSIIREYKPKNIIEVGSGFCTRVAIDAINMNGFGNVTSIDPNPRTDLDACVKHISSKVEDVDVDIFKELGMNDILFIDSSHSREEAEYNTRNILPVLNPGVIIHFHDITFPYKDSPEGNVLIPYLSDNKDVFSVIMGLAHIRYININSEDNDISYLYKTENTAGSIWIAKDSN